MRLIEPERQQLRQVKAAEQSLQLHHRSGAVAAHRDQAIIVSWLFFAFSGPVLWAISTHIDKYLVERYFQRSSIAVLLVFTALMGLLFLPVIRLLRPIAIPPVADLLAIGAAGILYMGAMFFYLQALRSEEASVIAVFFQATPVFAYGLGYLALGESPSLRQISGGLLIIAAVAALSYGPRRSAVLFKSRTSLLMLACAMCSAVSSVAFKAFAIHDEFWTTTFWTYAGEAAVGAVILSIGRYRGEFLTVLRGSPASLLSLNGINEAINLIGGVTARYALLLAPLALVQAITSTTALFVFAFGVALSAFSPALVKEDLSLRSLLPKGACVALATVGAIIAGG
jgi:uncharacterized membrane protein